MPGDMKDIIKEIKELADGSIDDQLKSNALLREKILSYGKPKPGVDESVIQELLPTIIKFMESNDHELQQEGANSITSITNTRNKANTQYVIDAGAIPKLKILLSSPKTDVLYSSLEAFINIAIDYPEKVVEDGFLQPMIQYLKSKDEQLTCQAAKFIYNISIQSEEPLIPSEERITAIFNANGVKPLIEILEESKNDATIKNALAALVVITLCNCQRVLDFGVLKSLKKICNRLFFGGKKSNNNNCETDSNERKNAKIFAVRLIKNITSYDEDRVDLIIKDNFLPFVLPKTKREMAFSIKFECIKVIENIIAVKPDFIPALVQVYNVFSFCFNKLGNSRANLIIARLTAMRNIIEKFEEGRDICRQKIRECGGPTILTNLLKHSNEEIRRLSYLIDAFADNIKLEPNAEIPARSNQQESEVIEISDDEVTPVVETPRIVRERKRPATSPPSEPVRRSKRSILQKRYNEYFDSSSNDGDENDDYTRDYFNSITGGDPTESNRNDHSGEQSFVGEDTVAVTDEQFRLNVKVERSPTPDDFDLRTTPESPLSRESTSSNNETTHFLCNFFASPSSSNNGNFQNTDVEHQAAVVDSETVATADGIFGNSLTPTNPSPPGDFGDPFSRTVPTSSPTSLPEPASTNGTLPNISPLRNPSPIPQPVITHVLPNQATTAVNDNVIRRDETIIYWKPHGSMIHQYCQKLSIQFNRKDYDAFVPTIIFEQITSNSRPDNSFTPKDKTGFGCLSILLTGNKDSADIIRDQIKKKFIYTSKILDKEKLIEVTCSEVMLAVHFEIIATWLECRILVYCSITGWKKYGSWETEDQMVPLFVLEKNENGYKIVLNLNNDV